MEGDPWRKVRERVWTDGERYQRGASRGPQHLDQTRSSLVRIPARNLNFAVCFSLVREAGSEVCFGVTGEDAAEESL